MYDKKILMITLIAVIVAVIACLLLLILSGLNKKKSDAAYKQELLSLQDRNDSLKKELAALEDEIKRLKGSKVSSERLEDVFGNKVHLLSLEKRHLTFKDIEEIVIKFFSYIDGQGYLVRNNMTGGAYDQYMILENDLADTIPIGSGETKDLYSLTRNASHFYRVLGKQRLFLVKDILTDESDIIEIAMKMFYLWYTYQNENGKKIKEQPSIQVMYDYAGYFLNSIGGKSYLLRRDSKTRLLMTFYSILIIDIANDKKMNSNGIDIRPHLKINYDDMNDTLSLNDRMEYLSMLNNLKIKYNAF